MKRILPGLLLLFVLYAVIGRGARGFDRWEERGAAKIPPREVSLAAVAEFREWNQRVDRTSLSEQELQVGTDMARARRAVMVALIEEDPKAALENAVTWSEYAALPNELKPFFERPFNSMGRLSVLPVCNAEANRGPVRRITVNGETFDASVYGRRIGQGSKEESPLAGIILEGKSAVAEYAFEIVSEEDAGVLANLPIGNGDSSKDFATGEALGKDPVIALAGGKRYLFTSEEVIHEVNTRLADLENMPGPDGGAATLFRLASTTGGSDGIEWEIAQHQVQSLASAWTERPLSVFYIRVDFSDHPGQTISQTALANQLNGPVKSAITAMSYGKSTINATVSATTVRLGSKSTYLPGNIDQLHAAAITAAGISSTAYDIIGVQFPKIGLKNGGSDFDGLADMGAKRQWMQGTPSDSIVAHEFGHSYGLGHASAWKTNDGSVAGSGSSIEYGNPFDVMGGGTIPEGHFNNHGKKYLNWIAASQWTDASIAGSNTYRIYPFDKAQTTGVRRGGVRVNKSGNGSYYWIGYRSGIQHNKWLKTGAYLAWEQTNTNRTWLLDTTPNTPDGHEDGALSLGKTYSDLSAGVHFTTVGSGGSGDDVWLDVNVQLGAFLGNLAPTAVLNVNAGKARNSSPLSVVAVDLNGDTLTYFWDFGDGSPSVNSPTVNHSWTVGGTYQVKVTVSDMKGGTTTVSKSVVVTDPLITWTERTSGTPDELYSVASGGGKLVAVGMNGYVGISRVSDDGVTWSAGTVGQNVHLYSVIHDSGRFVAAGMDYDFNVPGWVGVIYTSENGLTWTRRHHGGFELRAVAASGASAYVAVGDSGRILRSENGDNWSSVKSNVTSRLKSVAFGDGAFVAVGPTGNSGSVAVVTSPDGNVWSTHSSGAGIESWQDLRRIDFCNDRFVASGWFSKVRSSSNQGRSFSTAEILSRDVVGFCYSQGIYFAAGIERAIVGGSVVNLGNKNLISVDGSSWSDLAIQGQSERNGLALFNNTFVTVGKNGEIWQSGPIGDVVLPDPALAWQELHFPGAPPLSGWNEDFDGDGIPNLGEYSAGTDPKNIHSRVKLVTQVVGGQLTLFVPKGEAITGVAVKVQRSDDLSTWTAAGTVIAEDSSTQLVVAISELVATAPVGKGFLRVVYEKAD